MAFHRRRSVKSKPLACLLVGLSFLALGQWFLQVSTSQQKKVRDGSRSAVSVTPAVPPSASSPGPACVANASVNATADFEQLPARIQDYLRYRHCRHFPLLWDSPAKCAGGREAFLLLAVKSSPANYERRELIRRTWGQERSYGGRPVRRLFLLGTAAPEDAERAEQLAALVALEAREHSDVLQWAFADTFLNLTLKHVHLLNWLAVRCPHARFLLSGDDDVFVHTANVVSFLEAQPPDSHLFVGQLMSGSVPIRDSWSKYFVPPQLFSGPAYPVYCSGGGFLLSHYTIQALHRAARHTPLFPIDDAYMGMCLERAGLAPSGHEGIRPFGVHMPGARQPSFDPCVYRNLLLVHRFVPYEMLLMWKALHDSGLSCSQGHRVS
ncbi:acetylgalactosaminyl-O-glycosyl-glycoprotein beta-1,3-N-acetylglucosaminyltransferase [Camelus ferus]|uniref:Hexosyltransferase n=6 Tax=Camelus TaxID=9836 RepID=A0A8B8TTW5_CAMFR|nr:acetylgalactosaminyl-O-glycosyl-glycoprotein beta-1,3-N-acetylglucosaminyltransferase [Camelus ferus]XP_032345363.1 acetylgalactosaminyl-O-glycosyl-glycoprotein beta-1,3-N-acetylglucosaminyltransferase [Camelus ferus]XP_032345364.1 acetylgalactosaminyl-O-glycosyl-glycoprotein beta-1,3-N-acetylglucosaminyltransferase [Camelus ferus]XP_032345365.1 acetylgalactosaminyl-O-glycosyl-glycoprotein beta-1,3-N-acetylglucosaminyltransferase [Camelus ferus]XP_032345366.1 acetylgalactosaminyl-O-glycosyl-